MNSIALDNSGKAHISYYTNGNLKYATNATGYWVTTTVDSNEDVGSDDIALDTLGKVHISYYDDTNGNLQYATNASGAWVTTMVDSSMSEVEYNTSIALDTSDKVYIAYYGDYDLKYATNALWHWGDDHRG